MLTLRPYQQAAIDAIYGYFTEIAYEVSVRDLIDDGYLSPLVSKAAATRLDVSGAAMVVAPISELSAYVGRHVMIDLGSGIFREVTGAVFDALGHRLSIATPGVTVPATAPVHWMTKVRLDADRVELVHLATRTEMSAAVIEVPA